VGIVLSDGHLLRRKVTHNPAFVFVQSSIHNPYFDHVFKLLQIFCTEEFEPKFQIYQNKGSYYFKTMQLPCFFPIYNLFYINSIKVLPLNLFDILTSAGLAHWIMGDGSKQNAGVHISIYSFSLSEAELTYSVLEK